jgi:hypothetical protein
LAKSLVDSPTVLSATVFAKSICAYGMGGDGPVGVVGGVAAAVRAVHSIVGVLETGVGGAVVTTVG